MITEQRKKAERLLELHHSDELLILPNVWDVLGAKLLEKSGLKAIATASASVAFSNGYNDGQKIDFNKLVSILTSICSCTDLPVTADIERGFAKNENELADNIKRLIKIGIVGINIEDSVIEGADLVSTDQQCERIKLIRDVADQEGIPLVINARCDIYLNADFKGDKIDIAIERGQSYKNAGADCYYPILCKPSDLSKINSQVDLPLNVLATSDLMSMQELEKLGISRLSLGPSLLKAALTKMREVVNALIKFEGYDTFANPDIISSSDIVDIISN